MLGFAILAAIAITRAMRLRDAPRNAWNWDFTRSFLLFVALYILGSSGGGLAKAIAGVEPGSETIQAKVIVAAGSFVAQFVAIALIIFRVRVPGLASIAEGGALQPWKFWRSVGFGVVVFLVAWLPLQSVGSIVASIQLYFGGAVAPTEGHSTFELLRASDVMIWKAAMVLVVVVCAPLTEEFAFRGGFQMGLRGLRVSRWWRIWITSALFAGVHIPVLVAGAEASGIATLFMLAVVLGWLMERTGRIAAPITAHALFNLCNLMWFWWG